MPRKKQGLRNYHHKSRNGCMNCKRRRVKCDAQAPICANCFRRNECCTYQSLDSNQSSLNTPQWTSEVAVIGSSTSGTSSSARSPSSNSASTNGQWTGSLGFASNAATSYTPPTWIPFHVSPSAGTIESLCPATISIKSCLSLLLCKSWFTKDEASLWVPVLTDQANKYRYVQHCFFSLTCLVQDRVNSRYCDTPIPAYQHQATALSLFQQAPPVINEENWVAVLTFSVCIIVFQLTVQAYCPETDFDFVATLRVLRSSNTIKHDALPYLRKSKHWPLIMTRNFIPNKPLDLKMYASLHRLGELVSETLENDMNDDDDEERAEINREAFSELHAWITRCQGIPRFWESYSEWPSIVTPEYLEVLAEGDDIALLIFIHWCVVMYMSPKRWFVTAWAKRAAVFAVGKLKAEWGELLAWAWEVLSTPPTMPMYREFPTP